MTFDQSFEAKIQVFQLYFLLTQGQTVKGPILKSNRENYATGTLR